MDPDAAVMALCRRAWSVVIRYNEVNNTPDWIKSGFARMLESRCQFESLSRVKETSDLVVARRNELRGVLTAMDDAFRGLRFEEAGELLERAEALATLCENHQGSLESDLRRELAIFAQRN